MIVIMTILYGPWLEPIFVRALSRILTQACFVSVVCVCVCVCLLFVSDLPSE